MGRYYEPPESNFSTFNYWQTDGTTFNLFATKILKLVAIIR